MCFCLKRVCLFLSDNLPAAKHSVTGQQTFRVHIQFLEHPPFSNRPPTAHVAWLRNAEKGSKPAFEHIKLVHSMAGAAVLIYVADCLVKGQAHGISQIIAAGPAGFQRPNGQPHSCSGHPCCHDEPVVQEQHSCAGPAQYMYCTWRVAPPEQKTP